MTFDLVKIRENKREFRRRLAARPIEEELALLDALRELASNTEEIRMKTNCRDQLGPK
jgi:hypothetical protein